MQRALAALLRLATDAELADSILGDLEETRRQRHSASQSHIWFHRELLAVIFRAFAERVGRAFRESSAGSQLNGSRGDFTYAFRSLGSRPWYAGTVIGVIALSMALAMTAFAIVDGVLFKPLPYITPGQLYRVSGGYQRRQAAGVVVAPRNLRDWSNAVPGSEIAAYWEEGSSVTLGDLRSWAPKVAGVDGRFLQVLGVRPLIGDLVASDFESDVRPQPALIAYGLWQGVFGGRPDVIGQTLAVDETRRFLVRGVLPRDFVFPSRSGGMTNILVPIVIPKDREQDLRYRRVYGIARLPPSESLASHQGRMDAAAKAEAVDWVPRPNDGSPVFDRAGLEPLETFLTQSQRPMFLTIFGCAAALIVLGCFNVSALMASRADERWREFSTRRALGAGAARLVRLAIAESLLIVSAGILLGLVLASPVLSVTVRLLPQSLGLLKPPVLDGRVLLFAIAASVAVATMVSIWPVRRSLKARAVAFNGAGQTFASGSAGRMLAIAVQVALGFVLALGGTLLTGSLLRVWQTDPGFDADQLVVLAAGIQKRALGDRGAAAAAVLRELERIPGVQSVGATESPLLRGGMLMNAFPGGANFAVTPGFFQAAGLTLVEGRRMSDREIEHGDALVVLSEGYVRRAFPEGGAVGRTITGYVRQVPMSFTVIGIVKDTRFTTWDERSTGQAYGPYPLVADDQPRLSLVVRTHGDTGNIMPALLQYAAAEHADVTFSTVATATDLLDDTVRGRRLNAWMFGGFAAAALSILSVGILGLLAMTTARRARELGIRLALGATRRRIVGLLAKEQLAAVAAGLVAGGVMSFWAVEFVRSFVYQLRVYDPRLWTAAGAIILVTAAAGSFIPCWRATTVDPIQTLRAE